MNTFEYCDIVIPLLIANDNTLFIYLSMGLGVVVIGQQFKFRNLNIFEVHSNRSYDFSSKN